jgi:hypothetical protein
VSYDLVCASCSGLVEHARCATCQASRERLRAQRVLPARLFLLASAVTGVLALLLR